MGWWKVEGTDAVVGDEPLDRLGDAVVAVVSAYQNGVGRRPRKAEWEALLMAVLAADEADARVCDDGVPSAVVIEIA
jgi:hypothetical protein